MVIELSLVESIQGCAAQLGIRAVDAFHAAGLPDASWEPCDGGALIALGPGRFVNRALGVGLGGTDPSTVLDQVERFYGERNLTPCIEVCPWAGALLNEMTARDYLVEEVRDVYVHDLLSLPLRSSLEIHEIPGQENPDGDLAAAWVEILASGHSPGSPEWIRDTEFFRIALHMPQRVNLVAILDGRPCSTGSLSVVGSIGELGAATTLASVRNRGAQQALIAERLHRAKELSCHHAFVVAMPGSASSRNLQRAGFQLLFNTFLMRSP